MRMRQLTSLVCRGAPPPRPVLRDRWSLGGGCGGRLLSVAFLISLSVAITGLAAQQPVFRTETRLIIETVTVRDREGRAIEGLTAKDFVITEDGEPQEIAFVEFQRLAVAPNALPAPNAPLAPNLSGVISSTGPGDIRYRDKRLVVLYFDMTAMGPAEQMRAFAAAQKFLGTMDDSVLVAIMVFEGGAVRVKTDFTSNRAVIAEQILRLIYGDDLDGDGLPDTPESGTAFGQDDYEFNVFNTDRQLSALQTAMAMLRPLPERKSLVYFSSGLRLNGTDNNAQLRATTNAALRANVSIHAIDARGLVAQAPLGDASRPSPGGMQMFTGQGAMTLSGNFQRSQDSLYALSKDTGGNPMFDYNDLTLGITRAVESMTSYYIIGYYSTHPAADGRFRRVRVSLANGMDADVQFRSGYFADKTWAKLSAADRERQLEEALMLENPVTDITIAMELNYFQLNRAEYFVPVGVKIPGSELVLAKRGGAARTVIDFIGEVKDDYGITIQNVRDKLDIRLSADTASQLARRPIQYRDRVHAAPWQVRHQDSCPRRRDGPDGHVPDHLHDSEPQPRGEADSDELGRAEQPARAAFGRLVQRPAEAARRRREPAGRQRREAHPERHARVHEEPRFPRVPAGVSTRRNDHTAAGGQRVLLQGWREGVRDRAARGGRGAGSEDEGRAAAVHDLAGRLANGPLRLPGVGARSHKCQGHLLAGRDRHSPLNLKTRI